MAMIFDNPRLRCLLLVMGVSMCVFAAGVAPAAGQQTAAGIIGHVTDETGGVLPGVAVTATSPALQVPEVNTVTDEHGEYRLTPLPIGTYTVAFVLSGFQTVRRENVRLPVGFVAQVDVSLHIGSFEQSVTVSGASPIVDVTSTGTATLLTRETLELTPTVRNGIISLLAQVPSVRAQLDVGGSQLGTPPKYRVNGMQDESWVTMEGVVTTDPRTGGNYFNYMSIDEARVQATANDASVPARGVAVAIVVKSGGDAFHGGGLLGRESPRFQSTNIDQKLAAQGITGGNKFLGQTDQGGELGGRIIRGKLWFYGAGRYQTQDREIPAAFRPNGSPRDSYQGEILLDDKISAQLNPSNRLIGFSHWSQKYTRNEGDRFTDWGSGTERCCVPLRTYANKIEWESVHKSVVTSLQFGNWWYRAPFNTVSMNEPITIFTDAYHGGGLPATFDTRTLRVGGTNTEAAMIAFSQRYHARGSLAWYRPDLFLGNHEFKAGFDYLRNQVGYEWHQRGPAGEYRLIYNNGAPFQIDIYNNPTAPRARSHHTGTYLTDNWVIARGLTLNLGVRYAHDNGFIPAQCRQAGQFADAGCIDKIQAKIWNSVAPRLYAVYDIGHGRPTVLKGGWGRFYHVRAEDEFIQLNPFISIITTYQWHAPAGTAVYVPGSVNLDPNGSDFIKSVVRDTGTLTSSQVLNPNEKQYGYDQFSLTLERELVGNVAASISGAHIRSFNEPRRLNLLRPYDSFNIPIPKPDPGPDGIVGTADDPGRLITYYEYPTSLAGRAFQKTIIVADPRSNETHDTIELTLTKRFSNRWQLLGSYSATKNNALAPKPLTGFFAAAALDPNTEFNTGDHTWEWLGRLSGAYVLPAQVTLSANYDHRSGTPQARQVFFTGGTTIPSITLNVDPLGSLRLPNTNVLDLRADKAFSLGRQKVTVQLNVYNALNANTVLVRSLLSGPNYLKPSAILGPRILEFSMSYNF